MAIVALTTTGAAVSTTGTAGVAFVGRKSVIVHNNSAAICEYDFAAFTYGTGIPIEVGGWRAIDLIDVEYAAAQTLYVAAASNVNVRIVETVG